MKKTLLICAASLALAACGNGNNDNHDDNHGNDAGVEDTGGGGDEDTGGGGEEDMGGGGEEDMGGGGEEDMGGGGEEDMGGGGDMGGTDMGASRLEAYGCTYANATDMTGNATVSISDIQTWAVSHNVCVIVDAGTVVEWDGNFSTHPLEGGANATEDTSNPIDVAAENVTGNDTVSVTLSDAGDYAYFCGVHTGTMNGVIYVD